MERREERRREKRGWGGEVGVESKDKERVSQKERERGRKRETEKEKRARMITRPPSAFCSMDTSCVRGLATMDAFQLG